MFNQQATFDKVNVSEKVGSVELRYCSGLTNSPAKACHIHK